jgi:hypothetical protein
LSEATQGGTGEYDWKSLWQKELKDPRVDAAEYVGPVDISTIEGKGRGLRATRDVEMGELLLVSKPFAVISAQDILEDDRKAKLISLNLPLKYADSQMQAYVLQAAVSHLGNDPSSHLFNNRLYVGPDYPLPPPACRRDLLPPLTHLERLANTLPPLINITKLEAQLSYNDFPLCRFGLGFRPSFDFDSDAAEKASSTEDTPAALYPLFSFANYSCIPNANTRSASACSCSYERLR